MNVNGLQIYRPNYVMKTYTYKLTSIILIIVTQHNQFDCKYGSLRIISKQGSNVIDMS